MAQKNVKFLFSAFDPRQFPAPTFPEVAFAGRSNVGKSSLLNALLGQRQLARVSSTPGRTRAVNFFIVENRCLFADLPGYGFAKVPLAVKKDWKALIEGYLSQRDSLAGVVLLVDCRHPPQAADVQLASFLREIEVPYLLVATKKDKLTRNQLAQSHKVLAQGFELEKEEILFISSTNGEGVTELWDQIDDAVVHRTKTLKDAGIWGIPSMKTPKLEAPGAVKEKQEFASARDKARAKGRGRQKATEEESPEAAPTRKKREPLTPLHPAFYAPENKKGRHQSRKKARLLKKKKGKGRGRK